MKGRSRLAFSLLELLVVLAILGFLLALLLPAVAKVRQAAGSASSMNNLKQVGLACHNYHSTFNSFPPGNDANNFSAAAKILPYVEQQAVYQKITFDKPITDQANAEARNVQVRTFLSPLDPLTTVTDDYGATNYLFNAGSKFDLKDNDGVFYQDSKIGFASITDGTSNTLMLGETLKGDAGKGDKAVQRRYVLLEDKDALKNLDNDSGVQDFKKNKNIAADRCARWIDGRFLQGTFTGTRAANDSRPDVSADGAGGLSGLRSLDGTVNIALCDGSVRRVRKNIDVEVWKLLASRNDGQPIPDY